MKILCIISALDALAAAYLLQQGEDLSVLASFLRPAYGENQRKVLTRMLQSEKKNVGVKCPSEGIYDHKSHYN